MKREIVLDTETTGLSAKGGDRLVEIGCVELINYMPSGVTWHKYFNPQRDMPQAAFEVHGLSEEFLSDKPLFNELAGEFMEFIGDATLVIHNASFDIGFLNMELKLCGFPSLAMDRVIDTLEIARRKHPGAPNNLDALCKRYQIDNSARTKHGALLDSEILALVYGELIGGHQANLQFFQNAENTATKGGARKAASQRPKALPGRISEDEIKAHKNFVATLGEDALWNDSNWKAKIAE